MDEAVNKRKNIVSIIVVVIVFFVGIFLFINKSDSNPPAPSDEILGEEGSLLTTGEGTDQLGQVAAVGATKGMNYTGTLLAGSKTGTAVLKFNDADYKKAVAGGKLILIHFVSDWDKDSAKEIAEGFYPAFASLRDSRVVGFVATFGNDTTTLAEKEVARNFGVAISKTKIFIRDGERLLKSYKSWDKDDYLTETTKLLK